MSASTPAILPPEEATEKMAPPSGNTKQIRAAYRFCAAVTKNHYENFPVASIILPRKMRPAVQAIYAFSRLADDFADEAAYRGCRLEKLNEWEKLLNDTAPPTHPVFVALKDTIQKYRLPPALFSDLVTAFKMDIHKQRYKTFGELLTYCRYSANPVGRLVLHLFGRDDEVNLTLSDHICTALQLANFWQDVALDLKKGRIYLPEEDRDKYHVTEEELAAKRVDEAFKNLMNFQVERTEAIFLKGKDLGLRLRGLLGVEIRLTWLSGMTILKKIRAADCDVFHKRPTLSKADFARLLLVALSKRRYAKFTIQS